MTRTPARLHPSPREGGLAGDSTRRAFLRGALHPAGSGSAAAAGGGTARCGGLRATRVVTASRDVIRGTPKRDVIVALGGNGAVGGLAARPAELASPT
jgi:hypothetical protein